MQPLVELAGVRFAYPASGFEIAVEALAINAGERIACIGPSGSGKTTLVNLMTGIQTPREGRVTLAGVAISEASDTRRRRVRLASVGMVFQEFELLEYLTGLENILLPYTLGLPRDPGARERAMELARACGIERTLGRRPRRLSQGERQRLAICRALVAEPKLVVADEPTGNLDPATGSAVLDLLLEQASLRDAAVVMVTHNHGVLGRFDRVIDMEAADSAVSMRGGAAARVGTGAGAGEVGP
jgi:putative ABC transport system ATP-binding protein